MSTGVRIGDGKRVTLHFAVALEDGSEIDSTRRGAPATFIVGDGNLLPGFEAALFGLASGEDACITLAPEQAFGVPSDDNLQRFPVDRFVGIALELGLVVSFKDAANAELCGVVVDVVDGHVRVDFNHPLAGRSIVFDVSVLRVEDYLIT